MENKHPAGEFEGEEIDTIDDEVWAEQVRKLIGEEEIKGNQKLFHFGGEGSGFRGHAGRPGKVGGSSKGEDMNSYEEGSRVIEEAYNRLPQSLKKRIGGKKFIVEQASETRNMGTGKGGIVIRISPDDIKHPVVPEHEMLHSLALDHGELSRYQSRVLNVGKTEGYSQSFAQYRGDKWKMADEDYTSSLHSYLSEQYGFHGPTFETGIRIGVITQEEADSRRKYFEETI